MYSIGMIYPPHLTPDRTRGAVSNGEGRYATCTATREDDGWHPAGTGDGEDAPPPRPTELIVDHARRILTRNDSPDIPFDRSINPYKGCEHGCIYCYARPTHSYLDLSPGLDFETKIAYKPDALALLQQELSKPGYTVAPIAFGTNTDPWQPVEKDLRITRQLLELLYECRHPVTIVTKGSLILRDVDLLAKFAQENLVRVMVSVTTLDNELKAKLEPRAAAPAARLRAIRQLSEAGVPVGVMAAPMIPFINDHELEAILGSAREAGASSAGYQLLRLPHEVKGLFAEWLETHFPDRAQRVMSVIHDARGGKDNDPRFFHRMRGNGLFADLLAQRYSIARRKAGYGTRSPHPPLDVTRFRAPPRAGTHGAGSPAAALPPSLRAVASRQSARAGAVPAAVSTGAQGDLFA